jgi:protein-tyrosine-phosphatase
MAEGFFRKYSPEGFEPLSAGTKPISQINPLAVQVMNEIGRHFQTEAQRPYR